jgi:diguanylate cyclase (GGDEF)-like protein
VLRRSIELALTSGLLEKYKHVASTGEPLVMEVQFDDETIDANWVRLQVVKVRDSIAIGVSDITERKLNELQALHLAHHDPLTGLPNRILLHDRIGQAIERARRFGGKVAVFMVDLDSFKHINDTFGHATGDGVLVTVGVRLKAAVRATDSVIRIGGDEFVVVMSDISEPPHILTCAEKILDALQNTMDVDSHTVRTTCSVGFAVYPGSAQTSDELLALADAAMYTAKRRGKNQYAASDPAFSPPSMHRNPPRDTQLSEQVSF